MSNQHTPDNAAFKPAAELLISDLETLKILADPLRMALIDHFSEVHTVKEVAKKVGRPATKLYYHVNLLEKHGLITVTSVNTVSGILEKRYQASARVYRPDPALLTPGTDNDIRGMRELTINALHAAHQDLLVGVDSGAAHFEKDVPRHHQVAFFKSTLSLTPEQAEVLFKRFDDLAAEIVAQQRHDLDDSEAAVEKRSPYRFLMFLHPMPDDDAG